ncbi:hypothetical protein EG344_19940 [Chryseobacterium sp. G0162]|uniref:hypothetical protein n=1 Tax=Chryseobacterium sp. G0162 TaxID=2487063 RepID=UPI000F4EE43C|nr:hypothetical protein [Chryseobacterium sp. G0162]AZB10942.1 hypothetical protein EG344_19940 [Chryseobacterium sp. G0162]
MSTFKERYIIDFLLSRGWHIERQGNLFIYFKPDDNLNLPSDFRLEIPKFDQTTQKSYDNYISRLIEDLLIFLPFSKNDDDLRIIFSENKSIIKYRVFDNNNADGSISFVNYIDSLDIFKKMLSQSVSFVSTNKPIFADSKLESDLYLQNCRTLQTEKGSFITKIEVPNGELYTSISEINSFNVNNKLFDVIDFVQNQILNPYEINHVTENFISDYKDFINFELLNSIKDLYAKTNINNIEFELTNTKLDRTIHTEKVQGRIIYFNKFLRNLKNILLETQSIEVVGYVKKLMSNSPKNSNANEVVLETTISNSKEKIKVILKSDEYIEAIEAHKNEFPVLIKGKAKQGKTMIYLKDIENFKVLNH